MYECSSTYSEQRICWTVMLQSLKTDFKKVRLLRCVA